MAHLANLANPLLLESKTLWIGDLDSWMDEAYVASIFASAGRGLIVNFDKFLGTVTNVKVIRDKKTGATAGYGFVDFTSHQAAQDVLIAFNGKSIPGTNKTLKLNWGVFGSNKGAGSSNQSSTMSTPHASTPGTAVGMGMGIGMGMGMGVGVGLGAGPGAGAGAAGAGAPATPQAEHSIYVGELSAGVDETVLVEFFAQKYKSITGAKIIVDPVTRQSKGYGFVKFSSFEDAQNAIREFQGRLLRGRAIKTSQAHIKNNSAADASLSASSVMLNPLLALAANPLQASPYLMNPGNLALAGYGAQTMQNPAYQANYLGMPGVAVMPQAQAYGQTPQAYAGYQQPQTYASYNPQAALTTTYAQPTTLPGQTNDPYYQQMAGYYTQPVAYQQYPGYASQPQVVPGQQQYVTNPGSPFLPQQQYPYQQPQPQQQYQLNNQYYNPQFPNQKAPQPFPKQSPAAPPPKIAGNPNTPPIGKSQTITVTNLISTFSGQINSKADSERVIL